MLRRYPKNRKARSTPPRSARGPRRPYDTDLTDDQWARVAPLLSAKRSDPDRREVLNAVLYLLRTGCSWRLLPHDFPPHGTVADYYRMWQADGSIDRTHDELRRQVRLAAGKKVKGRKRHLLVDTMGLIVAVVVHSAGVQDYDGAKPLLAGARGTSPRLQHIWADGVYERRGLPAWVSAECGWTLEVVKRSAEAKGFVVQPRRWVGERTFAWPGRYRRLSRDYERLTRTSEMMVKTSMIHIMARRLDKAAQTA